MNVSRNLIPKAYRMLTSVFVFVNFTYETNSKV